MHRLQKAIHRRAMHRRKNCSFMGGGLFSPFAQRPPIMGGCAKRRRPAAPPRPARERSNGQAVLTGRGGARAGQRSRQIDRADRQAERALAERPGRWPIQGRKAAESPTDPPQDGTGNVKAFPLPIAAPLRGLVLRTVDWQGPADIPQSQAIEEPLSAYARSHSAYGKAAGP